MKRFNLTNSLLVLGFLSLSLVANAGPYQVYGTQWAWVNDWGGGAMSVSWGTTSNPSMTVSYNLSSGNLWGYPACIRGWHYGWNPANDNLFPMQVSAASTIPCTFSYNAGGTNMTGNFAYDLFLRWDNAKSDPQLEIMIWGDNNSWPIGTQTGTNVLTTGGRTFDLWEGMNSSAGYYVYTFIPHGTAGSGTLTTSSSLNVDMKVFTNWLQSNRSGSGHYNNSMYLDVVEAGIEITGGNGWAWMSANITATTGSSGTTYYKFQNRAKGLYIDGMGRTSNGSNCGQYSSGSSYNQQWLIEAVGSYVKLKNRGTGLYLDGMGRTSNGSVAGQWSSSTSYNQQWTQETVSGYVKFKNRATGLYLDGMGSTANGSDLCQWASSSSYNQQWAVTSLKSAEDEAEVIHSADNTSVVIYPNPVSNGLLNIAMEGLPGTTTIRILDMSGKVIRELQSTNEATIQIDLDVASGAYFMQVTNGEKNLTKKFVVQ